ncbi:MAG: alpha/beta hydrolase [Dehalococcoidia bacterium]
MSEARSIELAGFPGLVAEGDGERKPYPIVFLHGFWGHHKVFPTYLRFFSAAGFDCYAFSRRGRMGVPPAHARDVRFDDFVDDTLQVLDAIGREAIVVGWSLGGLIAQKVAEAGRCRAAVLVTPVAPRDVRVLPRRAALPMYLRHLHDLLLGRSFLISFRNAERTMLNCMPQDERRPAYETMVPDSGTVGRQISIGIKVDDKKVRCPVFLVVGSEDNIAPARAALRTAKKYAADFREYPEHSHWLPDEPGWEKIAQDIVDWLEEKVLRQAKAPATLQAGVADSPAAPAG